MPSNDPDIRNEPHLRQGSGVPNLDPAIDPPLGLNREAIGFSLASDEDIEHSVWNEPSLAPQVAAQIPESALTYANWLDQRRESWTQLNAWCVTLAIAALSVPCAMLAVIVQWTTGNIFVVSNVIVACLIGPTLQEICKVLIPLWVVEKRPYFFTAWFQFFLIAIVTATSFTVVSNFFLSLALDTSELEVDPQKLFLFQWVGVFGLNLITATVAAFGLEKIWRASLRDRRPPKLENGFPFFATAIGFHIAFAVGATIWVFSSGAIRLFAP